MSTSTSLNSRSNSPLSPQKFERSAAWQSQARNPISLRLYKVLSTNFDDAATAEALKTLSELYTTSNGVDSKGTSFSSSAARARKNLRRDMESKLLEGSVHFLSALGQVDQRLSELHSHIDSMRASCDEAEAHAQQSKLACKPLLDRAGSLRDEREGVEDRKSIVNLFLARFTLSEEEIETIISRDVSVGQKFFAAMDKTERIRDDCRILMAGEVGPSVVGLDIMASTSSHLEQGYEKMLRWCLNEFRQAGREMSLEVNHVMRESIKRLGTRSELLTEALTFLSDTRQATLLSSFLAALTRGGPSGYPRPIELHAHDPMRYVGDMLAWVHQVIAAERDLLESLFNLKSDGRMIGSTRKFEANGEEEEWIRELMDLAMGKLCVPLKMRVLQTIRSQESSIVSYKIANLLQFYLMTMRRTIGADAILSKNLEEITDTAYHVFYNSIEALGRAILRASLPIDDVSVTPSISVVDQAQILREIMIVYRSSLLEDEEVEHQVSGFNKILDIMVDPTIEMCVVSSEDKKRSRPKWDQAIYVLNCLTYLENVLHPFPFNKQKLVSVQRLIDERVKQLTDEHYTNLLVDAGLHQVIAACESRQTNEPLSRLPAMQRTELQKALHRFSLWLTSRDVVQSLRLSRLTVQRLHIEVHHAALGRLVHAYQIICEEVKRPSNMYEASTTLLGSERPFGQVHLLWHIFGLEEEDNR